MSPNLREGLFFCRIADSAVFLDIKADRYFRLSSPLEKAFIRYIEGNANPSEIDLLGQHGLLCADCTTTINNPRRRPAPPHRSAVEAAPRNGRLSTATGLEAAAILFCIRHRLKRHPLKLNLDRLAQYRHARSFHNAGRADSAWEDRSIRLTSEFLRARRFVAVDTNCLLDSISLVCFLARRGIHADLVFGVTANPFSAHAWVQLEDMIMNDTLGHATAHTPIWTL